jgi:hypothetical protein
MGSILTLTGAGNRGGAGLGTSVDLLVRFEDGADEASVTPTILANGSFDAIGGTWSVPVVAPKIDTAQEIAISGLHVGGAGSSDVGSTRSMKSNLAQDQVFARYTIPSPVAEASCGFAFRTHTTGATFNYYTVALLHGTGGSYTAMHFRDFSPNQATVETNTGTDETNIEPISGSTWYWVTLHYSSVTGFGRMRIYNPSTWSQIGSEMTLAMGTPTDFETLEFGRQDNHDVFGTEDTFIDDLALSLDSGTGATFPLLPS